MVSYYMGHLIYELLIWPSPSPSLCLWQYNSPSGTSSMIRLATPKRSMPGVSDSVVAETNGKFKMGFQLQEGGFPNVNTLVYTSC